MNSPTKWCTSCQCDIAQPILPAFSKERSLWDAGYCHRCGCQFTQPAPKPIKSSYFGEQILAVINAVESSLAAFLVSFGFREIDPLEFEELVRRIFQAIGFQAELTPASGDEGIDVKITAPSGSSGIIQCKRYTQAKKVVPQDVRALLGSMVHVNAAYAYIVTTSGFSKQAENFCKGKPITLIDYKRLEKLCLLAIVIDLNPTHYTTLTLEPEKVILKCCMRNAPELLRAA